MNATMKCSLAGLSKGQRVQLFEVDGTFCEIRDAAGHDFLVMTGDLEIDAA